MKENTDKSNENENDNDSIIDKGGWEEYREKIVEEARDLNPKTIWLQLGIKSEKAKENAKSINANYIENSCIKELVVTDSLPLKQKGNKIKVLSVAKLFADTIKNINLDKSISSQFIV